MNLGSVKDWSGEELEEEEEDGFTPKSMLRNEDLQLVVLSVKELCNDQKYQISNFYIIATMSYVGFNI